MGNCQLNVHPPETSAKYSSDIEPVWRQTMKQKLFNMRLFLCLVTCGAFAGVQLFAATDWPEFRGPTGQGLSHAKNVPIHWSTTSNVVWKTAIPGDGWSSP